LYISSLRLKCKKIISLWVPVCDWWMHTIPGETKWKKLNYTELELNQTQFRIEFNWKLTTLLLPFQWWKKWYVLILTIFLFIIHLGRDGGWGVVLSLQILNKIAITYSVNNRLCQISHNQWEQTYQRVSHCFREIQQVVWRLYLFPGYYINYPRELVGFFHAFSPLLVTWFAAVENGYKYQNMVWYRQSTHLQKRLMWVQLWLVWWHLQLTVCTSTSNWKPQDINLIHFIITSE